MCVFVLLRKKGGGSLLQIYGRSEVADVGRRVAHSTQSSAVPGNVGWRKNFLKSLFFF